MMTLVKNEEDESRNGTEEDRNSIVNRNGRESDDVY